MDQIFTNLLSNAVKYAPESPKIEVKAGTVGDNIIVAVRDHGLGVPKDELPKLFEKFFRASTSTGIPGTGIGLHLVKHLAELHQGQVTVDSTEGKGATFSLSFPIRKSEEQTPESVEASGPAALSA
jgi:signal transduction histidine kinase